MAPSLHVRRCWDCGEGWQVVLVIAAASVLSLLTMALSTYGALYPDDEAADPKLSISRKPGKRWRDAPAHSSDAWARTSAPAVLKVLKVLSVSSRLPVTLRPLYALYARCPCCCILA